AAHLSGPGADADLMYQCWNLQDIARRYSAFADHYEPMRKRDARRAAAGALADADAFAMRFALTHDFRRFPFIDPDLPRELLPASWPGVRARELFESYHGLLTDRALRYFDGVTRDV